MVDPVFFTNYGLDDRELEEYVLFGIAAAGKNAKASARGLDVFLKSLHTELGLENWQPFYAIAQFPQEIIAERLRSSGIGCHNLKARSFLTIAKMGLDLRRCEPQDLEKCPGIGFKTSRLFILHTRRAAKVACLDTHILKWLAELGYKVPKASPQNKRLYLELEQVFLKLAREKRMSPARLDLYLWRKYSGNVPKKRRRAA